MSFRIYHELIDPIPTDIRITIASQGLWWTCVTSDIGTGVAMTFPQHLDNGWNNPESFPLAEVAGWIFGWDLRKCSFAMAAINAYWNCPTRVEQHLGGKIGAQSMGHDELIQYVNQQLREGRIVVSVGHFPFQDEIVHRNLHILEKKPRQNRDLPDTACEEILPKADIALITGSSFVNKSLPRLLELARNAYVIMLGPSTPIYPGLGRYGVNKIIGAGLIHDSDTIQSFVRNGAGGEIFFLNDALSRLEIDFDK